MANEKMTSFPLSMSQADLFAYEMLCKKTVLGTHNLIIGAGYFDHTDSFDPDALEKAYFELLRRNDAFRMRIGKKIFSPKQTFIDVSEFPKPKRMELQGGYEAFLKLCREPTYPDITVHDDFLTKAIIYCCDDRTGGIIIWQHHICSDGYSQGLLGYRQLCEFYDCYKRGETPTEPKKIFSFGQYLDWERAEWKKKWFRYLKWNWTEWNHHFYRYCAPKFPAGEECIVHIEIRGDRYSAYQRLCEEKRCSDTSTFMTAMAVLAHKMLPGKRFSFMSQSHGRLNFAQKNTCGALLSVAPVFFEIKDSDTLEDVLLHTSEKLTEAYTNCRVNTIISEMLCFFPLRCLQIGARETEWMFFNNLRAYSTDSHFSLESIEVPQPHIFHGLGTEILEPNTKEGVAVEFSYSDTWMNKDEIEKMRGWFLKIFDMICANPDKTVGECIASLE